MKNTYNAAQKRSVRRFIRKLFSSWVKRQNSNCQEEIAKIVDLLRDIEESIDIIVREIARQAKRGE